MSEPIRRRSMRRHSMSTIYNIENRRSRKELSSAVELQNVGKYNNTMKTHRLSAKQQSICDIKNNGTPMNQENDITFNHIQDPHQDFSKPLDKNSLMSRHYDENNCSLKGVYDLPINNALSLNEGSSNARRRSERLLLMSQNTMLETAKEKCKDSSAAPRRTKRSRIMSNILDPADFHLEEIHDKKLRKISDDKSQCTENNQITIRSIKCKPKNNLAKRNSTKDEDSIQIERYYLDNTVINSSTSLETIFEEKLNFNESMSTEKMKRYIPFQEINENKAKISRECIKKMSRRRRKTIDAIIEKIK